MIIGHGNIARILNDREGAIFFASGVSNSNENDHRAFEREYLLLLDQPRDKCLFYFSSIQIFEKDIPYFTHKMIMESIIDELWDNYNIIRIGNIDFDTNPNTFLNFIRNKIAKGEPVEIKDEYRYMISQEQLRLLTDNLPLRGKNTINAFGRMAKVKDLI